MKTLPPAVSVGGHLFAVLLCRMDDFGRFDADRKTILLSDALDTDAAVQTLRHEMLHAAFHVSGISYAEKWDEEVVVRCIENLYFPAWDNLTKHSNERIQMEQGSCGSDGTPSPQDS